MTTPETARTAARNDFITTTAARHFPDAIRLCAEGHARGEHAMPPRDEIAVDCIHGAIALANKLEEMNAAPWMPEPQASKASEGGDDDQWKPGVWLVQSGGSWKGREHIAELSEKGVAEALGNLVAASRNELVAIIQKVRAAGPYSDMDLAGEILRWAVSARPSAPAGEAVSVAGRVPSHGKSGGPLVFVVCHYEDGTTETIDHSTFKIADRLSAPPPSTGDKPTPPPAPASKCHPCGVTTAIPVTVTETARLHEPAASLSVAPAREGFTYPDAAVEKAINRIVAWTKHASLENNLNLHDTPSMLTAARVTPPQQEEDRSWEKECEIRANGVVSYPSTASTTGFVYLVPDGRWLTYDQWLILDPSLDRFPSEAAALSALALARAPKPNP